MDKKIATKVLPKKNFFLQKQELLGASTTSLTNNAGKEDMTANYQSNRERTKPGGVIKLAGRNVKIPNVLKQTFTLQR